MNRAQNIAIRPLNDGDPVIIAAAFAQMGWNKPETQYRQYLGEQAAGNRTCFVADVDGQFAGYVTVNWCSSYPGFSELLNP